MLAVQGVTADSNQTQNIVLPDGTFFTLLMNYSPQQDGWFMSLTYGTFQLNSFRMFTSPNMLNQYSNQLPFGLALFTLDTYEPTHQQDFSSGYASIFVLTPAELIEYEAVLNGT